MKKNDRRNILLSLSECYNYGKSKCFFKVKDEEFLLEIEKSNINEKSFNGVFMKRNRIGSFDTLLNFYQIKFNDDLEIERMFEKIENEVGPYYKTLDEILKAAEDGRLTLTEANRLFEELDR